MWYAIYVCYLLCHPPPSLPVELKPLYLLNREHTNSWVWKSEFSDVRIQKSAIRERTKCIVTNLCQVSRLSMNRAFAATTPEIEKGPWNAWMWRVGISWLNLSRCDCQRKGRRSPSGVRRLCRWSQSRKCQSHWICLDVTVNEKVDGALRASVDFVVEVNPENANIEIRSPIQDYHGLCPIIRANRAPEGYILLIK